jgi:hypothetical protein
MSPDGDDTTRKRALANEQFIMKIMMVVSLAAMTAIFGFYWWKTQDLTRKDEKLSDQFAEIDKALVSIQKDLDRLMESDNVDALQQSQLDKQWKYLSWLKSQNYQVRMKPTEVLPITEPDLGD